MSYTGDSYVVASYEDETCGTEVRRFSQPLYECAFSADYGYVRTSCSYADTGSNSDIPHDAIYSLLLLLLLVPPIMYIVAMAMGGAAAGGAGSASAAGSKQGQTAVPKEEVEEPAEGDMEMS